MLKLAKKFALFIFVLCTFVYAKDADETAYDEYIEYVNEITNSFARQMEKEFGFRWIGDEGMMHEKIEEIGLSFNAYRRATIEEARALEVYAVNKLAQLINDHEKIQPFLIERPFKQVGISISFESINGRYRDGSVGRVFNTNNEGRPEMRNKIFYYTSDPFSEEIIDLYEEPFAQAEKIVRASPISNLHAHETTPLEEGFDQVLTAFTKKMSDEYDLNRWSIGGKINNHLDEIGAKFTLSKRATMEEARELEVTATESLLNIINSNEKLRPYLEEYPFTSDRIRMRISFVNEKSYSFLDETMESVALEGNEITYLQTHKPEETESTRFIPPPSILAKESYSEALKLVQNNPRKIKPKAKWRQWLGL